MITITYAHSKFAWSPTCLALHLTKCATRLNTNYLSIPTIQLHDELQFYLALYPCILTAARSRVLHILANLHSLIAVPCALRLVLEREQRNLAGSSATFLSFLGYKTSSQTRKLSRSFYTGIITIWYLALFPTFLTVNTTKTSDKQGSRSTGRNSVTNTSLAKMTLHFRYVWMGIYSTNEDVADLLQHLSWFRFTTCPPKSGHSSLELFAWVPYQELQNAQIHSSTPSKLNASSLPSAWRHLIASLSHTSPFMPITSFLMATSLQSRSYLTSKATMENPPVDHAKSKPSTIQTPLTKPTMSHSHTLGNEVISSACH